MPEGWDQLLVWFVTAFVGAGLVKLLDLVADNYRSQRARKHEKIDKVLTNLEELGRLIQTYRFYARHSSRLRRDDTGQFELDEQGNYVVENSAFAPEPDAQEGIEDSFGKDLRNVVNQQWVEARISFAVVDYLIRLIDSSGQLGKEFMDLHILLLKVHSRWTSAKPDAELEDVMEFRQILHEADEQRYKIIQLLERRRRK